MTPCTGPKTRTITQAGVPHLEPLSQLLNAHRVTQGFAHNLPAVSHFLFERLINHEAVHFIALNPGNAPDTPAQGLGFIQLYPAFSSESLMPYWTIGAFYVAPEVRGQGIGNALIAQALQLVRERGDEGVRVALLPTQPEASRLLEHAGFQANTDRTSYQFTVKSQQQ